MNELKLDVITELAKRLPYEVIKQVLDQMNESIIKLHRREERRREQDEVKT